jgi:hypothetical protein
MDIRCLESAKGGTYQRVLGQVCIIVEEFNTGQVEAGLD